MLVSVEYVHNVAVVGLNVGQTLRLSLGDCTQLIAALESIEARSDIQAGVLCVQSKGMPIGLDLDPNNLPKLGEQIRHITNLIASSSKCWIAALRGAVTNAAFELAMACHHRIAIEETKFSYTETRLQLLPCSGLTVRLIELLPAATVLDLLLEHDILTAHSALAHGLIDKIATDHLEIEAVSYAQSVAAQSRDSFAQTAPAQTAPAQTSPIVSSCSESKPTQLKTGSPQLWEDIEAGLDDPNPALAAVSRLVSAALTMPALTAKAIEWQEFQALLADAHARIPRHIQRAAEVWQLPPPVGPSAGGNIRLVCRQVNTALCEIAIAFHMTDYHVTCETSAGDDLTMECCARAQDQELLTPDQAAKWRANCQQMKEQPPKRTQKPKYIYDMRPAPSLTEILKLDARLRESTGFQDSILVAHSPVYRDVLARLRCRDRSLILACIGPEEISCLKELHYDADLTPAQIETLEIAAHQISSALGHICLSESTQAAELGWTLLSTCHAIAEGMLREGTTVRDIDTAMLDYGFAFGIFAFDDDIGLDAERLDASSGQYDRSSLRAVLRSARRLGRWIGKGWYDYPGGQRVISQAVSALVSESEARERHDARAPSFRHRSHGMIMSELLLTLQQTAIQLLEERRKRALPASPDFLDLVLIQGFGFPPRHGGPLLMPSP